MSQFAFGSGVLWGTPQFDNAGTAVANPTPIQFGTLQNVSLDISSDIKTLFGQNQFPVAVGRGKATITGKAQFAQLNGATLNSLFFGQTLSNGIVSDVYDTTGAAIPSTPYQITPTVPSSGTWAADLGVRNSSGLPMTRVANSPSTGQYSVSAGVYTFAAADTGNTVYISYRYTATSTSAKKSTVANVIMGNAPAFSVDLYVPYAGKSMIVTLPYAVGSKLTFATKQDDFMVPEFDFTAFADASGNVMTYAFSE